MEYPNEQKFLNDHRLTGPSMRGAKMQYRKIEKNGDEISAL
jgi:hypothetical protein